MSATHGDVTRGPAEPRPGPPAEHRHRADVQGLRAVAVLTVVLAHAGLGPLQGGFVGVDVFFVVSGFLISQLLYRELGRTGGLSLAGFYARRARRILPAATVVTLVTVLASVAVLNLVDASEAITDALWATLFAANVRFATTGVDYFSQEQATSPLQHYWSLAVEEQFYLVWPLLLLGCVAWAARRARRRAAADPGGTASSGAAPPVGLPRDTVVRVLVAVTALSFLWSLWATGTSPGTAYFSTFARAWELGVGALAALLGPALVRPLTPRARGLLALVGLVAIGVACVRFTEATAFPGLAALLPVLGAAAVLLAGTAPRPDRHTPWTLRALGVAPLRVVGDWSYSLYLWHWPVLVLLGAQLGRDLRALEAVGALALTFALAAATHRWVETPFRSPVTFTVPRALVLYPVSLSLVAVSAAGASSFTSWSGSERGDEPAITLSEFGVEEPTRVELEPEPQRALVQASVLAARNGVAVPSDLSPDLLDVRADVPPVECDYTDDLRELCAGGDPDGDRTMVVLGDSHARAWIPALEEVAAEAGYRTYHLVKVQCTAADVEVARVDDGEPFTGCTDFRGWAQEQLEELEPDLVVVSTSGPVNGLFVDGDRVNTTDEVVAEMGAGFERLFADIAPTTDRLVLLKDVPKAPEDPATCLAERGATLEGCMFQPSERPALIARASVEAARATGAEVVDPRPWFCWDGSCPAVVGSTVTYRDAGHITATRAAELAGELGQALALTPVGSAAAQP